MLAKDIMTKDVITVSPQATVRELAKILVKKRISGAPVVDKKGNVLGIASEADITGSRGNHVEGIMTKRVISVTEETPVEEIASLMTDHIIKRVPVMRGKRLVGIASRADIIRAIAMGEHIALHTPIYDL
jgi:CBS domain-containing protein